MSNQRTNVLAALWFLASAVVPSVAGDPFRADEWVRLAIGDGLVDRTDSDPPTRIVFVKASAAGANNGSSWTDAFTDLQSALAQSQAGDQIWIAAGTYRPAGPGGDRQATFLLTSGVALYGGLAGDEDPATFDLAQRNLQANQSMLSGDLNGNDQPGFIGYEDNSYHVVTTSGADSTAILDGLTIERGNAPGLAGGGILNTTGSPTLSRCVVRLNAARYGAGMISEWGSNPAVTQCVFSDNRAEWYGGGFNTIAGNPVLTSCVFADNHSGTGGAVMNADGSPVFSNCVFLGNTSSAGTVMYNYLGGLATFANCSLLVSTGSQSAAIVSEADSSISATNCILWGNSSPQIVGSASVAFSCVQGGYAGTGNISSDPLFVDLAAGNLELAPTSPCIDAGDGFAARLVDMLGRPRHDDPGTTDTGFNYPAYTDIGAYEFQGTSPDMGTLTIDSSPCKAEVFVDGISWGPAPQTRRVLAYQNHFVQFGEVPDMLVHPSYSWAYLYRDQVVVISATCYPDCNHNDQADVYDIELTSMDCNHNSVPDECDIAQGLEPDLNNDGFLDTSVRTLTQSHLACSIPEAIATPSSSNEEWLTGPAAFVESPSLDFGTSELQLNSFAEITQPVDANWILTDGVALNAAAGSKVTLNGRQSVSNGATASIRGTRFELPYTGTMLIKPSAALDLEFNDGVSLAGSVQILSGGVLSCPRSTTLAGTISVLGGTLAGGSGSSSIGDLTIQSTGRILGYGQVELPVVNEGRMTILADTQMLGGLVNNGTAVVESGMFRVFARYSGGGMLAGYAAPAEPAARIESGSGTTDGVFLFSFEAAAEGGLMMPSDTLLVRVESAFVPAIDDNSRFDMSRATLQLAGSLSNQLWLEAMSHDEGPFTSGLDRTKPARFPIGVLRLGPANAEVHLTNRYDNSGTGQTEAVYCEELYIERGTTVRTNGLRIYYKKLINYGSVDNRASLIQIRPTPCPADFDRDGHVDSLDLEWFLECQGGAAMPLPTPQCAPADLDQDADADAADFAFLQRCWTGPNLPADGVCLGMPAPLNTSIVVRPSAVRPGTCATIKATPWGGRPPYAFSWSAPDGWTSKEKSPQVCPSATTQYTLILTDSASPPTMLQREVTVATALDLDASANPSEIPFGSCSSLEVTVSGGRPPYSYWWTGPANWASTQPSPQACPDVSSTYSVTVTDSSSPPQTASAVASVSVGAPPPGDGGVTGQYVSAQPQVVVDPNTPIVRTGCGFCHPAVHTEWLTTSHSKALETLEAVGQGSNTMCLPCHVVGFGEAGGFVSRATTNALAGVQCESCHGAGASHVSNVQDPALRPPASMAMLDPNICGKCHTDVHHPTMDEWSESAHAGGEFWEIDRARLLMSADSCGVCHSGDIWQLQRVEGDAITATELADRGITETDLHPIVCATCHDPHLATGKDSGVEPGRDSQLRYELIKSSPPSDMLADATNPERFNLCGQCHHARRDSAGTATGSDTWRKTSRPPHRSPQANVVNGEMPIPPGTTSIRPNQQHAHSFTERQCATCHMPSLEVEDPTDANPASSGHRFEVMLEGCADCHPAAQNVAARMASFQASIQTRLAGVKARLDVAVPTTANGLPGWEYASSNSQVNQAALSDNVKRVRFIYYYVSYDGSLGMHNPAYVKDLLTYAELVPLP